MKQFNLEEALNGAKLITRGGEFVTDIAQFESLQQEDNILAVTGGKWGWYFPDGRVNKDSNCEDDIFMYTPPMEIYVNVYKRGDHMFLLGSYESLQQAHQNTEHSGYIKTIRVTDEI